MSALAYGGISIAGLAAVAIGLGIGGALGPGILGYLQQGSGDYHWSLYGAAAPLGCAAVFTLLLHRMARPARHSCPAGSAAVVRS